jgi:methyl-accepting chemotaxis protein
MVLKNWWSKTNDWLKNHKLSGHSDYQSSLDEHGLIDQSEDGPDPEAKPSENKSYAVVKKAEASDRNQSLEKLQDGFNQLIGQLKGINEHLNRQANHHEELIKRMENIPKLVESFPAVVENQKTLTKELLEQLAKSSVKNQQFIETIEKIPAQTARQTDALVDINVQLAASADTDVQMADNFNKFNETLNKLNQGTDANSDSITKMTKTFATSDRYMKYLMTRQNRQFRWLFIFTVGVCMAAILALVGIIIYLKQ